MKIPTKCPHFRLSASLPAKPTLQRGRVRFRRVKSRTLPHCKDASRRSFCAAANSLSLETAANDFADFVTKKQATGGRILSLREGWG